MGKISMNSTTAARLMAVLVALTVSGCTTAFYTVKADQMESLNRVANAPRALAGPYRMQVGDALAIRFYRNPGIDQEVVVRPDGMISLPFVDDVKAAGLTPDELDAQLTKMYTGELATPDLTVIVMTFTGHKVYVGGEVETEGIIDIAGGMTLFQAISAAKGFTDHARRSQVVLIRRDDDGKPYGRAIDVRPIANGENPGLDIRLQPFDMVHVPRSAVGNVNMWVDQYIREMLPVNPSTAASAATTAAIN